jgi:hypothetical protein
MTFYPCRTRMVLFIGVFRLGRVPGQPPSRWAQMASFRGASQDFLRTRRPSSEFKVSICSRPTIRQFQLHCSTMSNHSTRGESHANHSTKNKFSKIERTRWRNGFLIAQMGHSSWVSKMTKDKKLLKIQEVRNESNQISWLFRILSNWTWNDAERKKKSCTKKSSDNCQNQWQDRQKAKLV